MYQVATAGLEADSIAYPIRQIFKGQSNFHFRWGEVQSINTPENKIITSIGELKYDYLVIATGSTTNYFGNQNFEKLGIPMKGIVEALNLRTIILQNFEKAPAFTRKMLSSIGLYSEHTIGVNWYWNPNIKLQFNYINGQRMVPAGAASGNVQGLGLRAALEF